MAVGLMPTSAPERGCYIIGLNLHNAQWDSATSTLIPSDTDDVQIPLVSDATTNDGTTMPVIWLKPMTMIELSEIRAKQRAALYDCPVYSTEEMSDWTNIVASVELPTLLPPQQWQQKRVFMTCQLK